MADKREAFSVVAEAFGVEPEYTDNSGTIHMTPRHTALSILKAKGVDPGRALQDTAADLLTACVDDLPDRWSIPIPSLGPSDTAPVSVTVKVRNRDGRDPEFSYKTPEATIDRPRPSGEAGVSFPFPAGLEPGYYDVQIEARFSGRTEVHRTEWIICPPRAHLPPELERGRKIAGINVALYGLRSERNWGIGDFTDLKGIVDWAVEDLKVDFIGLNPLHALFNTNPFNCSPYSPSSRFFHNYIYLDVTAIADFEESAEAQAMPAREDTLAEIRKLRSEEQVNYDAVSDLKLRALRTVFKSFMDKRGSGSDRGEEFSQYVEAQGIHLERFATFCALRDHFLSQNPPVYSWREWPEEYRDPDSDQVKQFRERNRDEVLFWMYVQHQTEIQLAAAQEYARQRGMLIGLYHDEALGVDSAGADSWAMQGFFHDGFSVGAPPDPLGPDGQDWGFSPPNREAYRAARYEPFIRRLQVSCKHGGALRIDHVMQLRRLFWIPADSKPADGVYVRDYESDLLNILALESSLNETLIIGEDLGTVPLDFSDTLMKKGIFSYRVFYFAWDDQGNIAPHYQYPENALASINTHDLPTLAGFWSGRDIDVRVEIGQIDGETEERFRKERTHAKAKMIERLVQEGFLPAANAHAAWEEPFPTDHLHSAVLAFIFNTPCRLALINQEDVLLDLRGQNVPGTVSEHANWVTKMMYTVEELRTHPRAIELSERFRNLLITSDRSSR